MKIFFFKKSKIGHGITTWNSIPSSNTVTEFSKTFPVFYKWPDLTDVQVVLTSTVWCITPPACIIAHRHACMAAACMRC